MPPNRPSKLMQPFGQRQRPLVVLGFSIRPTIPAVPSAPGAIQLLIPMPTPSQPQIFRPNASQEPITPHTNLLATDTRKPAVRAQANARAPLRAITRVTTLPRQSSSKAGRTSSFPAIGLSSVRFIVFSFNCLLFMMFFFPASSLSFGCRSSFSPKRSDVLTHLSDRSGCTAPDRAASKKIPSFKTPKPNRNFFRPWRGPCYREDRTVISQNVTKQTTSGNRSSRTMSAGKKSIMNNN